MIKFKRALALMLVFVMAVSMISVAPSTTVNAAPSKYVKSLKLSKSKLTMTSGKTAKIKATVKVKGKASTKVKVSLSKANKKVVKKAKVGKPSKKGVSTITFTAAKVTKKKSTTIKVVTSAKNSKNKKITKKIKVTVKPIPVPTTEQPTTQRPTTEQPTTEQPTVAKLEKINVTADVTSISEKGGKAQLTVTSATAGVAIARVEYKSENEQIATVSSTGLVEGIAYSSSPVIITVTAYDKNGNKAVGTIAITVTQVKNTDATVSFTSAQQSIELEEGDTVTLKPVMNNAAADAKIEYKSDNTKVATVDANGKVTAVSEGKAIITATIAGTNASATATITVKKSEDAVGIASFEANHADSFEVKFTTAVAESEREKLEITLKLGNSIMDVNKVWAENGKSVELKYNSEYTPGEYTLTLSGQDIAISTTANTMKASVSARTIANVQIKTAYVPKYYRAKVYFDALDQYGDVMQNVTADQFVWTAECKGDNGVDATYAITDTTQKGYIVVDTDLENLDADVDSLTIQGYLRSDSKIEDEKEVKVNNLSVWSIKITGIKEDVIYQSDKDIAVELEYEALDSNGGDVDMEAYFNGAYTSAITASSSDETIVSAPYVNDEYKLVVVVKKNKNGKATVTLKAKDGIKSEYTVEVKPAPFPNKTDFTKADGEKVIAGEDTPVKLPVDIINQYEEVMEPDTLKFVDFSEYFNIAVSGVDGIDADDVDYLIEDGKSYVTVDAKGAKSEGMLKIQISSKQDIDIKSTYELQVTAPRAASRIKITAQPDLEILVGQTTKIEFVIQDMYSKEWTDDTTYIIDGDDTENEYIKVEEAVINGDGTGYIEVTGLSATTKAGKQTVSLNLKTTDNTAFITTEAEKFEFVVNNDVQNVTVTTDAEEYVAGQKVKLTLTAKYGEAENEAKLTTYNETIKAVEVYESVKGTKVTTVQEVAFVDGVATIEVDAMYTGDEVTYSIGNFVSPSGVKLYGISSSKVKIVAGEAVKYALTIADDTLTVAFVDTKGNVVTSKNDSSAVATITIKTAAGNDVTADYINGLDASNQKTIEFVNGVATIDLNKAITSGCTVTVKYAGLEGTYTLD